MRVPGWRLCCGMAALMLVALLFFPAPAAGEALSGCAHTFGEWAYVHAPTCSVPGTMARACTQSGCGFVEYREAPLAPHSYGLAAVIDAPSCSQPGMSLRTCGMCGHELYEEIPAQPHDYGTWSVVPCDPAA